MKILPTPQIHFGENALEQLPGILTGIGAKRVLIITDKGIINTGICDRVQKALDGSGCEVFIEDRVEPDPSIDLVQQIADRTRKEKVDALIGLGGGSSIDSTKVAAALSTNTKDVEAYIGIDLLEKDSLPVIAIPTTAGTGSEVTHIAILSDEKAQLKKGIVSPRIIPSHALLDPALTTGLPPKLTAATGMDALCHCVEAFTSVNASPYSDLFAEKAIKLIAANLRTVFAAGSNMEARSGMLLGSLYAGISFANAGVTAVHAFAYPLGGMFHVPHGLANSLMLPTVLEYNLIGNEERFSQVAALLTGNPEAKAADAAAFVNKLSRDLQMPQNLKEAGIPEEAIEPMAEGAVQVTRLLVNNPRPIDLNAAIEIYRAAFAR
jgi:alcohol dehydrogenase class IV